MHSGHFSNTPLAQSLHFRIPATLPQFEHLFLSKNCQDCHVIVLHLRMLLWIWSIQKVDAGMNLDISAPKLRGITHCICCVSLLLSSGFVLNFWVSLNWQWGVILWGQRCGGDVWSGDRWAGVKYWRKYSVLGLQNTMLFIGLLNCDKKGCIGWQAWA